jgi:hypothetical protein
MYPPTRESSKIFRLPLLTWKCAESEDHKEVVPMCPKHTGGKTRFGKVGNGVIVTCESGSHLVRMCEREPFDAEREEARARLYPGIVGQEEKVP